MYCPRLDHFVRFNPNGTVSRCGHMVNSPEFDTLEKMGKKIRPFRFEEKGLQAWTVREK